MIDKTIGGNDVARTADQVVSNIMRAMHPKAKGKETPEQVILLNALRMHGLDAQVRSCISKKKSAVPA